MLSSVLALAITAMPAYLQSLPWNCEASTGSSVNGLRFEHLTRCRPQGRPSLPAFVQTVADAMGNAGHPPRLRFGPHGPFVYVLEGTGMISASFVEDNGMIDVWIAITRIGVPTPKLPILPDGVEVITDHVEDSGKRMLSMRVNAASREANAVLHATMDTLGATALSKMETNGGRQGYAGRLLWNGSVGFFHLTESAQHESILTLYAGDER